MSLQESIYVVSQRMEPGGIEPPSRDSQQDASTRVFDYLISASHRESTPCVSAQPLVTSSPARQEAPRADQPDNHDLPPHRASSERSEAKLGRECELRFGSYVLRAFYEASTPLDAPHQAFPIRSNAISAPVVKDAPGMPRKARLARIIRGCPRLRSRPTAGGASMPSD